MKTRIHVNQHIIKANKKSGTRNHPLTVKNRLGNDKASEVAILGPSKVVYRPDNPLPCGATCWIETDTAVDSSLDAKFKANHAPSVQANIVFDQIGYQIDVFVNGKHHTMECRDFGGKSNPKKLSLRVVELLEQMMETLRKEN